MPDHLTERFARLAEGVHDATNLRPATAVRARGDRRRTRMTAALTGVVAAGTAGGVAGATALASGGGQQVLATELPASYTLPHQGQAGWTLDDDPRAPSPYGPCDPTITLTNRTDALTGSQHSDGRELTEQVLLYATPEDAENVLDAMSGVDGNCGWGVASAPGLVVTGYRVRDDTPPGGRLGLDVTYYGATAFRLGNAVYLWYGQVVGPKDLPDTTLDTLVAAQDEMCTELGLCDPVGPWCELPLNQTPFATPVPPYRICVDYSLMTPEPPVPAGPSDVAGSGSPEPPVPPGGQSPGSSGSSGPTATP